MTETASSSAALVERERASQADPRLARLAPFMASHIRTAEEWRARVAAMQEAAFVLSPAWVGQIAAGYEVTPTVVVVDPSVDPASGMGADVYHSCGIHRCRKRKIKGQQGESDTWKHEIETVSLNHHALLRMLAAAGVEVDAPRWLQDGTHERYLWVVESHGSILEFDGRRRPLASGLGSLDARDGSADIGGWTLEEWARRARVAEQQRAAAREEDRWKIKPDPIGGWTAERVAQVRHFGRQMALTKSLNGLARRLGVRQAYGIEELARKPFVFMRLIWMPDLTNPRVAEMVAAAQLGATALLYPQVAAEGVTHGYGEPARTLAASREAVAETPTEPVAPPATAPIPADSEPVVFDDEPSRPAVPAYVVTRVTKRGPEGARQYFAATAEGVTLYTRDLAIAKALAAAAKDGQPRVVTAERVAVDGQTYAQVVDLTTVGGLS
jgi:hypothetical protein